ncbi:MAG: hypothetical protein H6667_05410 [Ardenticatenaceae bacterium]|nr:hypothetical protein [Ardenticatenaceae bacterium]
MKNLRKMLFPVLMVMLTFLLIFASADSSQAQALTAPWTVAVTYQNVGTQPATVVANFYAEGSATALSFDPLSGGTIAAGAAKSFWIGNVNNVPAGFRGNAVILSDQPLTATAVQFSQQTGFKMRLLYNGFQSTDASDQYFIATTLLNKFNRTTVFSIQNTENEAINATVRFYDADNSGNLASTITHQIPANSSKFIEMNDTNDTGLSAATTVFNGSAIITAVKLSDSSPANVVASANEYYTNRNVAASFEGVPFSKAGNSIYMATGLCERFGLDTFYAVSNASLIDNATITVTYRNTDGTTKAADGPYTIGPGQKRSIITCNPNSGTDMSSFTGSAVITSTGAPIVAIGKAQNSTNAGTANTVDVFTAFVGEPGGASTISLSFVRWANDTEFNAVSNVGGKQRTFIAIQNLESTQISVNVNYKDKDGNTVATQPLTIPAFAKANTDAKSANALGLNGMTTGSFGYYTDGTFGGAVTIEAAASNPTVNFIAIARGQNPGAGEDVNGVPTP